MSGSAPAGAVWIQTASTPVLLVVAGHCVARLVQAGRAAAWTDDARHPPDLLMALGLAAMLPLPRRDGDRHGVPAAGDAVIRRVSSTQR